MFKLDGLTTYLSESFRGVQIGRDVHVLERRTSINGRWLPVAVTTTKGFWELEREYFGKAEEE